MNNVYKYTADHFIKKGELFHDSFAESFKSSLNHAVNSDEKSSICTLTIESSFYKKQTQIVLSQGINLDHEEYLFLHFLTSYIGNESEITGKRKMFSLKDYCHHRGNKFFRKRSDNPEKIISQYFRYLKKALNEYGLKELLCSDGWSHIPIDWSPYK